VKYRIELGGAARDVEVRAVDGGWEVAVDRGPFRRFTGARAGATAWRLDDGGGGASVDVALDGERLFVRRARGSWMGTAIDPRAHALELAAGGAKGTLRSPMPGSVVRVLVAAGDAVTKGQVLVVVEAMKMENEFRAAEDGVVSSVGVTVGQAVEAGAVLVVMA
jgi:biotin carboxyl carrier protein